MDLLSDLDATRSACFRGWIGRDRKVPAAMVATFDEFCGLALAARPRIDCLRALAGRRRLSGNRIGDLAIPASGVWLFSSADMRAKRSTATSASPTSRRHFYRNDFLQRIPCSETGHPRSRTILFGQEHRAKFDVRSHRG